MNPTKSNNSPVIRRAAQNNERKSDCEQFKLVDDGKNIPKARYPTDHKFM